MCFDVNIYPSKYGHFGYLVILGEEFYSPGFSTTPFFWRAGKTYFQELC